MAEYICECCEQETESQGASIKVVDGKAVHDVKCECGKYMSLKNPKSGAPSFRSNRYGQVF